MKPMANSKPYILAVVIVPFLGTVLAKGVRAFGLRRSRYRGMEKTHLQHLAIATVINLVRTLAWLDGKPLATTRTSKFAALALVA